MNRDLADLLKQHDGVVNLEEAVHRLPRHVLKYAHSRRQLIALLPGVYVDSGRVDDLEIKERAALIYAGEPAVLSHLSALRHWSLPLPSNGGLPVHVTVPVSVRITARRSILVVHRSCRQTPAQVRAGRPVTRLERTVVDSWPLLHGPGHRAPAIAAVAERMTTPQRLLEAARQCSNFRGRASLLALCDALANGCRSELELGAAERVRRPAFCARTMATAAATGDTHRLPRLAFPRDRVAVELDGAAYHGAPDNRERDIRRDAALSALGWVSLRFSHRRLHSAPNAVRDEVADVLMTRRQQLGAA